MTTWSIAEYDGTTALRIWRDGQLVAEIPQSAFLHLIADMAAALHWGKK